MIHFFALACVVLMLVLMCLVIAVMVTLVAWIIWILLEEPVIWCLKWIGLIH